MVSFFELCEKVTITTEEDEKLWDAKCKLDESFCVVPEKPKCKTTPRPLDFIYERKNDTYDL